MSAPTASTTAARARALSPERVAVLLALNAGEEISRAQVQRRVGHLLSEADATEHLASLIAMGYIKRHQPHDAGARHRLTSAGIQARQLHETPGTVATRRELAIPRAHYSGAELRPFTGRPGAMAAYALPSRGIGA